MPAKWLLLLGLTLAVLGIGAPARAHDTRMAFLEIRQTDEHGYGMALKIPAVGRAAWPLEVQLPPACDQRDQSRRRIAGNLLVEGSFRCDPTLLEPYVLLQGMKGGYVDVLVRVVDGSGRESTRVVSGSLPRIDLSAPAPDVVGRVMLGIRHIVGGPDHLAFIAGLLLLCRDWRRLAAVVTAFTVAHSVTLALTTLGVVAVPRPPVEAFIAFSIVYLAYAVCRDRLKGVTSGMATGHLWKMVFAFGLVHGFGFAGALAETGMTDDNLVATLLLVNVGIEIGQLAFLAVLGAFLAAATALLQSASARRYVEVGAAYGLGCMGSFWLIERVAQFL